MLHPVNNTVIINIHKDIAINSGAGKYDVVLVSDALMPRMIEKGLVQKLNKDNIPNISQMDKQYLDLDIDPGNQYSVPYMFGTVGLIYNKDVVKEKVDSWDILWDEKYKDQIFMFDTYRDTIGVAFEVIHKLSIQKFAPSFGTT